MLINEALLITNSKKEIPIEFGNIIGSVGNELLKLEGETLHFSDDLGRSYTKQIDISGLDSIKYAHVFESGELLICDNQKAYYTHDWGELHESTVLDIDGNPYVPSSVDNFSLYKKTSERQIVDGKEVLCWGNYSLASDVQYNNINAWYTADKGVTVKSCFKFMVSIPINETEPLKCRHLHNVDFNINDQTFWMQTGDEPTNRDSHWVKGIYSVTSDTWSWELVGSGDNYKTSNILFYGDYMYYAWDIYCGGVARCRYDEASDPTKHELVFATPNDCIGIYMGERGDMVAFITRWGGNKKASTLYYSEDLNTFHEIEGVLPPELDYHQTIYYKQWAINDEGKLLAGVFAPGVVELSDWDGTPSVWIDEIIKKAGFPDALKPL